MEQVTRMEGGADGNTVEFQPVAPKPGDGRFLRSEETFHGGGSQGDDHLWGDDGNLGAEIRKACVHLIPGGFAVAAALGGHVRAAFQNVGDVNFFAGEFHRGDHLGEKLAGPTDERLALFVLIGSGSLAHKHELGLRVAHAEDHLSAGLGQMRADGAGGGLFFEGGKAFGFGAGR